MRRRGHDGISPLTAGLLAIAILVVATFFAFTKEVPFRHHYEIRAEVRDSGQLAKGSLVRIAGVNAGKVEKVQPSGRDLAVVTMRIDDAARPVHRDATMKIRVRTALEGNEFVDLRPGSPGSPELADGGTIPVQHTAHAVQIDQVLATLTSDTRRQLIVLLDQYGRALAERGARGINRSVPYWRDAYRDGALVNQALLGREAHDLSHYIGSAGKVAGAIDQHPANVRRLIGRFDEAAGAFAAERDGLGQTVAELPGTLDAANRSLGDTSALLPHLDRFASALRPTVREAAPTIDRTRPLLRQLRALATPAELQGLARDLRPTIASAASLSRRSVPLLEQVRLASSCQNTVLTPWANSTVQDPQFTKHGRVYQEAIQGVLPGLAGESRSGDANGQWFTPLAVAGLNVVSLGNDQYASTAFPVTGVNPQKPDIRPPLRPNVPCETQSPPDLRSIDGSPPPQFRVNPNSPANRADLADSRERALKWLRSSIKTEGLSKRLRVSDKSLTLRQLRALKPATPGAQGANGIMEQRP